MKTITWKADERMIPGWGLAQSGSDITLPSDMANSFVRQGLADSKKQSVKRSYKAEEQPDESKEG